MTVRIRFDDSARGRSGVAVGVQEVLCAACADEVPGVLAAVDDAVLGGRYAAGFVGYGAAPAFDPALHARPAPGPLPEAWFAVFDAVADTPTLAGRPAPPLSWAWDTDPAAHRAAVTTVQEAIASGWTYQVNLTTRLRASFDGDPAVLYEHLIGRQRAAHQTLIETGDWAVLCASPELFFRLDREGTRVTARPMKGTARRSPDAGADAEAAERLRTSAKETAENVMIVDLIRSDLGRIATEVAVDRLFTVEPYPTVWQLTSTVEATVPPATGVAGVFAALFPSGSVTGAPKAATMDLIDRMEPSPRGVYCGAVGVAGPDGAEFAVAIRTVEVDRLTGRLTYGVGGGITASSDADAEWDELLAKTAVLP